MKSLLEKLDELRMNIGDSYWRADHPEVNALLVGLIGGALGLLFVWLELRIRSRYNAPRTTDV